MLDFLGRISAYWAGLPSLHLLLFVLVIWVVFALILLADARNKLNQWCFIGGMRSASAHSKNICITASARRSSPPAHGQFPALNCCIPF